MNLFDFARNGFVTPKMIKLETESQILTGGRFRFSMAPFLSFLRFFHHDKLPDVRVNTK